MTKLKTERNPALDYFKILLSILVITIHIFPLFATFSFKSWVITYGVSRIAVPCFFVISGYFIAAKIDNTRAIVRYIKHLFIIYIVWTIIYYPFHESYSIKTQLLQFIGGFEHLWFIPSLLIGILILFALKKRIKNDTYILLLAAILFFTGYIMHYIFSDIRLYRNGILLGFPFVAIGYLIHNKNLINTISLKILCVLTVVFTCTLLLESYISFEIKQLHESYISLFILCPLLFIFVMKYPKRTAGNIYLDKVSAGIYYVHYLVIYNLPNPHHPYRIFDLPAIFIISVILSIFIIFINKRIKIFL